MTITGGGLVPMLHALQYNTILHYTLNCITLHYATLHCITLPYIALHTHIHTYVRTCVPTYLPTYIYTNVCMHMYICISLSLSRNPAMIQHGFPKLMRKPQAMIRDSTEIPKKTACKQAEGVDAPWGIPPKGTLEA